MVMQRGVPCVSLSVELKASLLEIQWNVPWALLEGFSVGLDVGLAVGFNGVMSGLLLSAAADEPGF
jgi:hypothetical protein